jgi:NADPH:quinone reductase-like Zn-dependent oxidoreductase
MRELLRGLSFVACLMVATGTLAAPAQMQAMVQEDETLSLRTIETPKPAAGQVLVRVYAAGVNPVDWKRKPKVPGFDIAGVIDGVGPGVTKWRAGTAVVAWATGGYAQYAIAEADDVVPKPRSFTFAEASGIPIASVAAFRAVTAAKVTAKQRVVIIGAAGGSGSAAVQIAKARGAHVVAIGHSSQRAFLQSLKADEILAYDKDDVTAKVGTVDAALNMVDGQSGAAIGYVKRGGQMASIAGAVDTSTCITADVTCTVIGPANTILPNGEGLRALVDMADKGQYRVTVSKTFPLAQAAAAQQLNRNSDTTGKIILIVDPKATSK